MIPQLIYIMIAMISFGISIAKHGKPRDRNYNWWSHLLALGMLFSLLYFGGFWDVFFK